MPKLRPCWPIFAASRNSAGLRGRDGNEIFSELGQPLRNCYCPRQCLCVSPVAGARPFCGAQKSVHWNPYVRCCAGLYFYRLVSDCVRCMASEEARTESRRDASAEHFGGGSFASARSTNFRRIPGSKRMFPFVDSD